MKQSVKLSTISDYAKKYGITRKTAHKLIDDGGIVAYYSPKGRKFVNISETPPVETLERSQKSLAENN